ncbi:glycosyltransferase [Saccharolobus caldissimus]|uniref:Group 1 glycosyl transferase n=1 Tax=Saccharolobus caldissimus TaxID=1702097 RepID=A0AAQ4CVM2_9CREN|nr:glycosyltransferase [Saccharolobus caldissimus]BDB99853.1 group 1 glycosyl transferase [Saccharolobus caldissimus]
MKICFLTSHLKERDGASRAVINFTRGIKQVSNHEPCIITLDNSINSTKLNGIEIIDLKKKLGYFSLFDILLGRSSPLKAFKKYLNENETKYIVATDDLVPLSEFSNELVYWSQGVLISIFFWKPFYNKNRFLSTLASPFLLYNTIKFSSLVQRYRVLLANSRTSAYYVSLFYNRTPKEVVYPPIDVDYFKPSKDKENFVLVILKRGYPSHVELIKKIAEKVKMKVIGYKIPNAEYLEKVSDEELRDLYSSALVVLYPVDFDYFGYIPVESMASGTPVIAFKYSGGPSETIIDGKTGWLASDEEEFYKLTLKAYKEGYPEEVILNSRRRAETFSIQNQTRLLLSYII